MPCFCCFSQSKNPYPKSRHFSVALINASTASASAIDQNDVLKKHSMIMPDYMFDKDTTDVPEKDDDLGSEVDLRRKSSASNESKMSRSSRLSNASSVGINSIKPISRGPLRKFREELPACRKEESVSIWSILKSTIGKDLTRITMPIALNEPISFIQRVSENMEYCFLLEKANQSEDIIERIELVTAFAISGLSSSYKRMTKPFNPLLGETFEYIRPDLGFAFLGEQVSHHPPITAFHADGQGYSFFGSIEPRIKFGGRTVDITPQSSFTVRLHKYNEIYVWNPVQINVSNIFFGTMQLNYMGNLTVENLVSKCYCVAEFKDCKWLGKGQMVEGYVYNERDEAVKAIYGNWSMGLHTCSLANYEQFIACKDKKAEYTTASKKNRTSRVSFNFDIPDKKLLYAVRERPKDCQKYFSFSFFTLTLNELLPAMTNVLCPTDARFRPDLRLMEEGDWEKAETEKIRLEEKQRSKRKLGKEDKPRWFVPTSSKPDEEPLWLSNGEYWKRDWGPLPADIF